MKTLKFTLLFLSFIMLFCMISLQYAYASSGENEYIINSSGQHEATRGFWSNVYGTEQWCDVVDIRHGEIFTMSYIDASVTLLNGFHVQKQIVEAAKKPGARGMVRNERAWVMCDNVHTSNYFTEGVIQNVNTSANEVTIHYYQNYPGGCVLSYDTTLSYNGNAVMKYEGNTGTENEVLQSGRHLRLYKPRKQVVYAFTPDVFEDNRTPRPYGPTLSWVRRGFFRGMYDGNNDDDLDTYFAEYRDNQWIDTWSGGVAEIVDGFGIKEEGLVATARPGDMVVTVPRAVGNTTNNEYGNFIPMDDGSTIGYILEASDNSVKVEVKKCPTGKAQDGFIDTVEVSLDADAEYHLNGQTGSVKSEALEVGNFVRILPNIENGMLCVRDAGSEGMDRWTLSAEPDINALLLTNDPMELTISGNNLWQGQDTVRVMENTLYELEFWMYSQAGTEIEWTQDGKIVPGTQETISNATGFVTLGKYATLSDSGSVFKVKATTDAGTTVSSPILVEVFADTSSLEIANAIVTDNNTISLTYNKRVEKTGAEKIDNYSIDKSISINDINLIGDQKTVIIKTSEITSGETYTITVNNVQDIASSPNTIADNSTVTASFKVKFRYFDFILTDKEGSLTSGVREIRYIENDTEYGLDYHDTWSDNSSNGTNAFDDDYSTNESLSIDDQVGLDLGNGEAIAPDSVKIAGRTATGRKVTGFKIMASNNKTDWTKILEWNADIINDTKTIPIDLSILNPEDILTGAKQTQEITFPEIPDHNVSDSPITLQASSDKGLTINYLVMDGPAEVSGDQLTLKDTGDVWVRATQPGNDTVYSAYPKDRTFHVSMAVTGEVVVKTVNNDIYISPNPFNDFINIYGLPVKNADYKLYNLRGQLIKAGNTDQKTINLSGLNSGIYILQINSQRLKIIKK